MKKLVYSQSVFTFEDGTVFPGLEVAFHCSESGYHEQKVILIFHALTANSDPEDWWPEMVGPGKVFDPGKYFIFCCNMLGSCYGSSGPSSINPETGKPYYFSFPRVTVRDIVRSVDLVRRHLGIEKIDLLVGSSIGGFQAIEYSIMYPEVVRNAVFMATHPRVSPWLSGFEETQRMALEADPSFREALSLQGGREGLRCARAIAILSYRCEEGLNLKQREPSEDTVFAGRAASYMQHQGTKLADRFDAYSYWYLSWSIDSQNVGRGRGGVKQALGLIQAKTTLVGIDTDLIFSPPEIKAMASSIKDSRYLEITSSYGHDGFLLETEQLSAIFRPILENL